MRSTRATTVTTRRGTRALAAAGLGAVLLLTGCGGGGDDATGTDASGEEIGPLGEYFDKLYSEPSDVDFEAQQREVEELTASCMQEQGFDYTPMDVSSMGYSSVPEDDGPEYGSEEYAATEGYGMTTWEDDAEEVPAEEEWVDPNEDYVAAMSEGEQTAYYEALYGPPPPEEDLEDPDAEMVEYDWTTAGCSGKAQHEVSGEEADPFSDPAFASLQEEIDRLYTSVAESPELAAVDAEWAGCMADAGFTGFTTQQDAMDDINERSNALYESTSEDQPEPDPAAMDELQQLEIDTAVADHRCKEEVDYDAEYQAISLEAEEEFVETHRAELDAWVEAAGQEP
jgi:hypothetical protein